MGTVKLSSKKLNNQGDPYNTLVAEKSDGSDFTAIAGTETTDYAEAVACFNTAGA